jgi:hypothetical protein
VNAEGFRAVNTEPLRWEWCPRCAKTTLAVFSGLWVSAEGVSPLGEFRVCADEFREWRERRQAGST